MKRARPTPRRLGWSQSAQFRQIGRDAIRQWNAKRDLMPRCDAVSKSSGGRCRQWPMQNGRCHWHGGRTGRGDLWHLPQYADCSTAAGEAKFNRKLRDLKRYADKRAARLAAMTPEQRARHDAWHRAHAPGAAAPRRANRERTRQSSEARGLIAQQPRQLASDPEATRIERALAAASVELARLEARSAKPTEEDEGIFS
jgi:hypothetical protein